MSQCSYIPSWKARWVLRRNAILGSPGFQRWASRMPVVRSIARRKAAAQFDMIAGFVYSQILSAFVESELIGFLNGRLRSLPEVAAFTKLGSDAASRLLHAGESLQISQSPDLGFWTLGEAGAALSCNTGAMAMIRHHRLLYKDLTDPLVLFAQDRREETALSAYWTYASKGDSLEKAADYSELMAATQPMVSQQIIDAYDFSAHRRMLDVGGGSGAFASAILQSAPTLEVGIFDLPEVIAATKQRLGSEQWELHPGSFKTSALPEGYDLITLCRIAHDHDDDVVAALLANIHSALPEGGRLLIVEPMADSPQAKPMGHAYFGLYLWAMGSGRPRTRNELTEMLKIVGFGEIKSVRTDLPIITSALVAIK
ncbi:methyltransferase [Sphingorhabdus sp.]|uniref:methyltransferase n=1 Tax=Sphingorhabdus sp. TaxID=1902408 RepID=UPI00391CAE9E